MVTKSDEIMLDVRHINSEQMVVVVVVMMAMAAVMTIYEAKFLNVDAVAKQVQKALNVL
jgi:hypothetical protein